MTLAFLRLRLTRCDEVRGQINISWLTYGCNDLPGFAFSAIIWLPEIKSLKLFTSQWSRQLNILDKRLRAPIMPANLSKKKRNVKNQVDTTYRTPSCGHHDTHAHNHGDHSNHGQLLLWTLMTDLVLLSLAQFETNFALWLNKFEVTKLIILSFVSAI